MHQQRLAGLEMAALERVVPDREERLRDRCRLDHREVRRHRQRMALIGGAVLRVAAADHQRHHLVAELPALHARTERRDLAGDFEAGNVGRAFRRRVESLPLHHVRTIDAGGRDLDQDFALAERWDRALLRHQHLRPASGADPDHGHGRRH